MAVRHRPSKRGKASRTRQVVISSLDGFFEDAEGKFDWAPPDDEVHAFVNDLQRPIGTYLYGRRMYETMGVLGDREHRGR
jgi:dihydrofolate reductase